MRRVLPALALMIGSLGTVAPGTGAALAAGKPICAAGIRSAEADGLELATTVSFSCRVPVTSFSIVSSAPILGSVNTEAPAGAFPCRTRQRSASCTFIHDVVPSGRVVKPNHVITVGFEFSEYELKMITVEINVDHTIFAVSESLPV